MAEATAHLRVIEESPAYWRAVFDNPPLNIMGAIMFIDLQKLLARMDASPNLRVVVFESANPEFYLAHFDIRDIAGSLGLMKTTGPSGLPLLMDTFVRLTKSPVVSIAKIRGRARGVCSEFVLACESRFAGHRAGRLRRCARAPNRFLRSAPHRGREEARQPSLAAIHREAPRRREFFPHVRDVAGSAAAVRGARTSPFRARFPTG